MLMNSARTPGAPDIAYAAPAPERNSATASPIEVTALRGRVRSGNSGGPIVDDRGRVLGTVFAATASGGQRGGFAVPDTVVRSALAQAGGRVGTGPCAG